MIIELKKKDLTLETQAIVDGLDIFNDDKDKLITSVEEVTTLKFEGFAGFNEKYVRPLFDILCKNPSVYKAITVVGNLYNDESKHQATFYIIRNVRDTAFLFKTLRSFSINLPEIRLGYECSRNMETLYLDRKILNVLSSLDEPQRNELVFYFYCLAKFFKATEILDAKKIYQDKVSGSTIIAKTGLDDLYKSYPTMPESVSLNCIQLKEDVCFESITYPRLEKPAIEMKYSSSFVYNVIKTKSSESLVLINTTTKEYFVIGSKLNIIFTNNTLKEYNTFDMNEWMPYLISNIFEINKGLQNCTLKHLALEKLFFSEDSEVHISNDVGIFDKLLENYPNILENNDMKFYSGYFTNSKIISEGSLTNLKYQYDKDMYAQELYKQVQPYYETFDLKDLTGICKGVANGAIFSMLFEGESGTGKSTAARVIASRCGLPFVAINCSTNIEEADIFGTMIPNPEKNSVDDPEFIWKDGPLTKAIRYGYVGIIEELGFGRPGVLGKINSLLDESRQIDLPNGEVLKCHPNFRIIATTNIGYEGTNRLNKALVNRFEICKKFVDLDEREAKAVIIARTGYTDLDKIAKVFDVYKAIKKYSAEQNLSLVISIRQLLNIFKQGKYYRTSKDAINNLLLNQAFLEEPEHLKYFTDTVLKAFDLTFKI